MNKAEVNGYIIYSWPSKFGSSDSKEFACNEGDPASIPGSGRSPGDENGNPLQYSCLEISMDKKSMHDTGCLGLVHWDDPEGWYGEGGGRGFRIGNMCIPVADSY